MTLPNRARIRRRARRSFTPRRDDVTATNAASKIWRRRQKRSEMDCLTPNLTFIAARGGDILRRGLMGKDFWISDLLIEAAAILAPRQKATRGTKWRTIY